MRTSLLAGMVGVHAFQGTKWTVAGEVPGLSGDHHPSIAPYGIFATAPRRSRSPAAPRGCGARCAGRCGWDPAEAAFATNPLRVANRDELVARLESLFADRATPSTGWRCSAEAGVPSGKVRSMDDVYAWDQVRSQGLLLSVDHPTLGAVELPGSPVRFDDNAFSGGRSDARALPRRSASTTSRSASGWTRESRLARLVRRRTTTPRPRSRAASRWCAASCARCSTRDGPVRLLSMCTGDGRDTLPVLAEAGADVDAVLVELDPELAETARRRPGPASPGRRPRPPTPGRPTRYRDAVPADVVMACGMFGNVTDDDVAVHRGHGCPRCWRRGGHVIWTRGSRVPHDPSGVRRRPERAGPRRCSPTTGFEEVAFDRPDDASLPRRRAPVAGSRRRRSSPACGCSPSCSPPVRHT